MEPAQAPEELLRLERGEAADLGRGFGTRIMQAAIERCFAEKEVAEILIDPLASNVRAQRFYARLGFRFAERRSFGEDDCQVMRLSRADRKKQRQP